jgi:DNA-binding MarR family transcriptional regulator
VDAGSDAALRASRAMLGIVARSVAPALEQVTLPQFRVLVLLETSGAMRVGALAERLGIVLSTFSRSLDRLESGGWVERVPSEESRREVTVSITSIGSRLVQEVSAQRGAAFDAVFQRIPPPQRSELDRAFAAFADAAGEPDLQDLLVLGM